MRFTCRHVGRILLSPVRIVFACVLVTLMAGCATPQSMHVRNGVDPRNQDDDVRFRTTYYFRVFDVCDDDAESQEPKASSYRKRIVSDSLYRFTMTGKASSLSNVHFESGTLQSSDIEPFGASVAFDAKSGRFSVRSQRETAAEDARNRALMEVRDLLQLRKELQSATPGNSTLASEVSELDRRIGGTLTELGESRSDVRDQQTDTEGNRGTQAVACSTRTRRGFQILGAEGWRTFDQDERLLMAMSTRAEPLIETLRELSHRILNQKKSETDMLRPLLEEHGLLQQALRTARVGSTGQTSEQFMDAVIAAYQGLENR